MDIKTFLITFCAIFLAEIGDKTQFATLAFSLDTKSKISVFLGASLALICSSLIAVIIGSTIAKIVPFSYLRIGSAFMFIAIGIWMLIS